MLYFQQYSHGLQEPDHYNVTVYSDVNTFKWLLKYIKSKSDCIIDGSNVLSILVSAEFLQMPELVIACIDFICDKVNEVSCLISNIGAVQSGTWDK